MKPHPHLFKQSDFRSSTAAPLCVRSVDMAGRLAQPRAARRGGRALLITIVVASFLWLMVSAETVAVFAQADVANSTVKGRVVDQAGAGVRRATVTVMNPERGIVRSVKTDDEGEYRVPISPTPSPLPGGPAPGVP